MAPDGLCGIIAGLTAGPTRRNAQYAVINPLKKLEINRFVLRHPKVAEAHRGVRVAQITDIHFGPWIKSRHLDELVDFVNRDAPDVIALTGDYVGYNKRTIKACVESLRRLEAPTFAVLGNHDHWASTEYCVEVFAEAQIPLLSNEWVHLDLRGAMLQVVGVDDAVTRHDDVDAAFEDAHPDLFNLTLNHVPAIAWKCADAGADLILSGHTHGFQFNVPRLTNAIAERMGTELFAGPYRLNGAILYISRGLGSASWPRRYRAHPELTFFELEPSTRTELELVSSEPEATIGSGR